MLPQGEIRHLGHIQVYTMDGVVRSDIPYPCHPGLWYPPRTSPVFGFPQFTGLFVTSMCHMDQPAVGLTWLLQSCILSKADSVHRTSPLWRSLAPFPRCWRNNDSTGTCNTAVVESKNRQLCRWANQNSARLHSLHGDCQI